jgi:hypothetical protein
MTDEPRIGILAPPVAPGPAVPPEGYEGVTLK